MYVHDVVVKKSSRSLSHFLMSFLSFSYLSDGQLSPREKCISDLYRAAWEFCLSVRLSVRLSVCPSVKRVICDKMEKRSVQIFIPCDRSFSLVSWEEEWMVGGRPILPEILDQTGRVGAKSPIFDLFSLVAAQT